MDEGGGQDECGPEGDEAEGGRSKQVLSKTNSYSFRLVQGIQKNRMLKRMMLKKMLMRMTKKIMTVKMKVRNSAISTAAIPCFTAGSPGASSTDFSRPGVGKGVSLMQVWMLNMAKINPKRKLEEGMNKVSL
jgi:hypothetical protein